MNGWGCLQSHSTVATMALSWSFSLESSRPPDRSSFCLESGARRVLASKKNTCCLPSCRSCFIHLNHPRHLIPRWLEVDGVSEVVVDWWCHTRGYSLNGFPLNGISRYGSISCCKNIQKGGEISFQDARRELAMFLLKHASLILKTYFSGCIKFIPIWG